MKTKVLTAVGLFLAANLFGATALHHYTFDGAGVTDLVGSADGTLFGGATNSSGMLALNGTTAYARKGSVR